MSDLYLKCLFVSVTAAAVLLVGCDRGGRFLIELSRGGTFVVYDPQTDRIIHFGPAGGENLLYTTSNIFQPPDPDGYVSRGGSYTWVAPQSCWVAPDGRLDVWPPEPAMDRGPMKVLSAEADHLHTVSPKMRLDMREDKTVSLDADGTLRLTVTLLPTGPKPPHAAGWCLMAVPYGCIVAVPKGKPRSNHDGLIPEFKAASTEHDGWILTDTNKIKGVGKVFIDVAPVVAVWNKGYWFVRAGTAAGAARPPGESAVELYFAPSNQLVEVELVGPHRPVLPDGSNRWDESWHLIKAKSPSIEPLNRFLPKP